MLTAWCPARALGESSDRFRLIALDLDGTLLRSDGTISERTRRALSAATSAGLTVVSVTARPPRRVRQLASAIGLDGLAICSNGGVLYDLTSDTLLQQTRLSGELAGELVLRLRRAAPGVCFAVEVGAHYGCEPAYTIPREHSSDRVDPALRRADALVLAAQGVTKLIVQHPEWPLTRLLQLATEHAEGQVSVTHSGSNFVEVAALSVTKASALEAHCRELAIAREAVVAFGDMPNDLPMLAWAGHAVAVANAHAEVLAIADELTASNDEDGVARVLERLAREAMG